MHVRKLITIPLRVSEVMIGAILTVRKVLLFCAFSAISKIKTKRPLEKSFKTANFVCTYSFWSVFKQIFPLNWKLQ